MKQTICFCDHCLQQIPEGHMLITTGEKSTINDIPVRPNLHFCCVEHAVAYAKKEPNLEVLNG